MFLSSRPEPSRAVTLRLLSVLTTLSGVSVLTLMPALALGVMLASSPLRATAQAVLCAAALSGAAWGLMSRRAATGLGPACAPAMSVMYGMLATGAAWAGGALALQSQLSLAPAQALGLVAVAALAGFPGFVAMNRSLVKLVALFRGAASD